MPPSRFPPLARWSLAIFVPLQFALSLAIWRQGGSLDLRPVLHAVGVPLLYAVCVRGMWESTIRAGRAWTLAFMVPLIAATLALHLR